MMRPLVWLPIAALLLVGCRQGPGVDVDPFGRTTIPPPPTGAAAVRSASDPYYSGPGGPAPPLVPVGSTAGAKPTQAQHGQGGRSAANGWASTTTATEQQNAGRLRPIAPYQSADRGAAPIAVAPPATSPTATVKPVASEAPIPTTPPANDQPLQWSSSGPGTAAPQATSSGRAAPRGSTDLTNLPTPRSATPTTGQTHPSSASQHATASQNVTARRELTPAEQPRIARYGYAKDYNQLQGRLEYSAAERQWKLRYIPIHGQMDIHGGSVVLPTTALEDFQAGDYVIVQGRLDQKTASRDDGQPRYVPSSISPLY